MIKKSMNAIEAFVKLKKEGGAIHPIDCDAITYRYDLITDRFHQFDEILRESYEKEEDAELYVSDIFKLWVHITGKELLKKR